MRRALPWIVLLGAVVAVYARVLDAPFVYDDKMEVVGNRTLRSLSEPAAILGYNPARALLIVTYALNWAVGGLRPLGYHLVSLALHLANLALVRRLAGRWMAPERAWLATALWALHPMCTETVTYVTGRSDALVATWILVSVTAWVDAARGSGARWPAWAAWAAGLLSKQIAIVTPLLWLAAELWTVAGGRRRLVRWPAYAPAAVVVGLAGAAWTGAYGWPRPEVPRTLAAHLGGQAEVWTLYLRLWLLPVGQSIFHDWPAVARPAGLVAGAAWIVGLGLAVRRGGVSAVAAVGWAAVLLVSSAFVLKETMAEHRTYLAGVFLAIGLVAALPRPRAAWALVPLLAGATVARNEDWRSETTLWASATRVNPESAEAWYGLGDAWRFAGEPARAEAAYRTSLEHAPDRPDTLVNLGIVRAEQGDAAEATALWKQAMRLKPGYCAAGNNLAALDRREGRFVAAVSGYMGTLRRCPDDPIANLSLGDLYWEAGDMEKARVHYGRFLASSPLGDDAARAAERMRLLGSAPGEQAPLEEPVP